MDLRSVKMRVACGIVVLFLFIVTACLATTLTQNEINKFIDMPAVRKFREYIQIDTSIKENLPKAVEFWRREASEAGFEFSVYEPAGLPVCVMKWQGTDSTLPSIMLNSHMDVVIAHAEDWIHPPFSAFIDDLGDIYGRGTQDTKDIAIQYLEALKKLKLTGISLKRTIYMTLMPDEETGGHFGLEPFIKTAEFKAMKIGFVLDEGLCNSEDVYLATFYDKRPWQLTFRVYGSAGHGSGMPEDTAIFGIQRLLAALMEFRKDQRNIMLAKKPFDYGAYTTLNINILKGGSWVNVIPNFMELSIDMRLAISVNVTDMMATVDSWAKSAGNSTHVEWIQQVNVSTATPTDGTNPYWMAITDVAKELGKTIEPIVNPAKSDVVNIRNMGIPGIGFSTKVFTTSRMHNSNEYLNVITFLNGIDTYAAILKKLGNLEST